MPEHGAGVLDALSLAAEAADELLVATARDTHLAILDRVHGLLRRPTAGTAGLPEVVHRGIAGAVYGSLGQSLRLASVGLDRAAATGAGPALEDRAQGRFVQAAVNGLIGDKLLEERPQLAIPMAVRVEGRDVVDDEAGLAAAFPDATGTVVVMLHGLCENEAYWSRHAEREGTTYPRTLRDLGATPVLLRYNSGLPLRENGVALTALLQRLVDHWPVPVTRLVLVGHSMGGLVVRAAGAVEARLPGAARPWADVVSDVVLLGTPNLGAPIAWGVGHGSRGLGLLPESAAFGRILDWRSRGVHDLVHGLAEDVAAIPGARYHLVAATLTRSVRHPAGDLLGDLLVRPRSAYGRDRQGHELFPDAELLHVGRTDHFGLLNHPDVREAFARWLA